MLATFIIKHHFCGTDVKLYVDLERKEAELTVSHKRIIQSIEAIRPWDWQHVTTPEKADAWLRRPMGERGNAIEYLHWLASTGRLKPEIDETDSDDLGPREHCSDCDCILTQYETGKCRSCGGETE